MYRGQLAPVSNQATWTEIIGVTDAETGELKDLSAVTEITVKVRNPATRTHVLSAALSSGGVTIPSAGTVRFSFAVGTMVGVCPGEYEVGITFVEDGETVQLLIGTVPVLDGIVG